MKWFLPVLFISYMAGITLFTHSHVVNGVTIVHSHPFKKGGEHSHTTVEFQLIHILDHTLVTDNGLTPLFVTSVLSLLCIFLASPQRMRYCRPSCSFQSQIGFGVIEAPLQVIIFPIVECLYDIAE